MGYTTTINGWVMDIYYVKECGKPNAINHLEFTNVYVVRYWKPFPKGVHSHMISTCWGFSFDVFRKFESSSSPGLQNYNGKLGVRRKSDCNERRDIDLGSGDAENQISRSFPPKSVALGGTFGWNSCSFLLKKLHCCCPWKLIGESVTILHIDPTR